MKELKYVVVEKDCCGTCKHYYQHYTMSQKGGFDSLWFGHCGMPRIKSRMPDEICHHWASRQKEEDRE